MAYHIAIDALAEITKDSVLFQMKSFVEHPTSDNLENILRTFCKKNNIETENEAKYSLAMITLINSTNTISINEEHFARSDWRAWLDSAVYYYMASITEPDKKVHKTDFVRCLIAVKWCLNH